MRDGLVPAGGVVLFLLLIAGLCLVIEHGEKQRGIRGRAANWSASREPPHALLRVNPKDFHSEYSGGAMVKVTGRVTNVSSEPRNDVMAVVEFETAGKALITSEDGLVDFQPIMPGQTSPFTVYATWNPQMAGGSLRISFTTILGEPIPTEFGK